MSKKLSNEEFTSIIENQLDVCYEILLEKQKEYATEDRLHNFNVAAELQGTSPEAALAGMMAKHTVSIYDMCHSDEEFDIERWNEKITDHMVYLLLLKAIIRQENKKSKFDRPDDGLHAFIVPKKIYKDGLEDYLKDITKMQIERD